MTTRLVGTNPFGTSGYDCHTNSLFHALWEFTQDVKLDVPLQPGWQRFASDAIYNAVNKQSDIENDTVISIMQPPFWKFPLSDKPKKFYGYCIWEGERIPKDWLTYLLDPRVDGILVPSQHVKDAIINTINSLDEPASGLYRFNGLISKIHKVPHGVDLSKFSPQEKDTDNFVFVCNKGYNPMNGMNDRGGVQFLLKAFNEEFKEDEKVELRIKLNPAYLPPNINLHGVFNSLGIEPKNNIKFNWSAIEYKYMKEFYKGDVFISTSMADAANIPILEALACGLPVITTNFGGMTDFIDDYNGWLIGGELKEVKGDLQHENNRWLTPDINEIRKVLRHCFNNREEVIQKGKKALESAQSLTWRKSASKLLKVISSNSQ